MLQSEHDGEQDEASNDGGAAGERGVAGGGAGAGDVGGAAEECGDCGNARRGDALEHGDSAGPDEHRAVCDQAAERAVPGPAAGARAEGGLLGSLGDVQPGQRRGAAAVHLHGHLVLVGAVLCGRHAGADGRGLRREPKDPDADAVPGERAVRLGGAGGAAVYRAVVLDEPAAADGDPADHHGRARDGHIRVLPAAQGERGRVPVGDAGGRGEPVPVRVLAAERQPVRVREPRLGDAEL